jgi:hypothetical protein
MFVRVKAKEPNRYLQIVENRRAGKRTLQRVVATLGRVDELAGGGVDALLISLSRFAGRVQVLLDELKRRLSQRGWQLEWAGIRRDLVALMEIEVRQGEDWYYLRTALPGVAGKALQAAGVAIPPAVRPIPENVVPKDKSALITI